MLRNSKEKKLAHLDRTSRCGRTTGRRPVSGRLQQSTLCGFIPLAVLHHRRHQRRHSTLMPLHRAIVSPCRRARSRRLYLVPVASVSPVQPAPGCSTPTLRNRKE